MVNVGWGGEMGQANLLEFLRLSETYEPAPAVVECIETHASYVFLAGNFAYKVKRAVKYPFLDFSTLERRRQACFNELRPNRRTAPQLYVEVIPITCGINGGFRLRGEGEPVEWVLVMRRFAQEGLYDRMAAEGRLALEAMVPLAGEIAGLHAAADRSLTVDQAVDSLENIIAEHEAVLAANSELFPPERAEEFAGRTRTTFSGLVPLLKKRALDGYVRHCHGDLHLRNIVEIDGRPVLFDALEFDDRLATIDVLYDLAFLLMDLGKRGLARHGNAVLNGYLEDGVTGNLIGLAALPFFLSLRATVRAKVEMLRGRTAADPGEVESALEDSRTYFELAWDFLRPARPYLVAVGGLSGSGKSAVARAIAPDIGGFPGAVIVRSDIERKRLFGMAPEARLPEEAYTQAVSDQVYAICRKRAGFALAAGRPVILDAVHAKPEERDAAAALADAHGAAFTGLWLEADAGVLRHRVAMRVGDASDATPAVVDVQLGYDLGDLRFDRIDASGSLDAVAARCLDRIAN
jgi:aminoglycoside phosphotransferase family enzyme/predicted kinase